MSTSISWTDDSGAAELTNGKEVPFDRFSGWKNWTSTTDRNAAVEVGAGTGRGFRWPYRKDRLASFELRMIPMASLGLLERLKDHLEGEGEVTVAVGDAAENEHVCVIAPGTTVEYEQADPVMLEYTLSLTLKNVANLPLTADYSGVPT